MGNASVLSHHALDGKLEFGLGMHFFSIMAQNVKPFQTYNFKSHIPNNYTANILVAKIATIS